MFQARLLFPLGLAASCIASSACSMLVDSERLQCTTDRDCTDRGPGFRGGICVDSLCQPDPTWGCLDTPNAAEQDSETVHIRLTLADLLTERPVPGVQLTLCSKLDATCMIPVSEYESDADGKLDVALPAGFDGYLQTEGTGIYPTMFFPSDTNKQRPPSTLPIVPMSFMGMMVGQLGVTLDENRAVVMTTALDCSGAPAPGVELATAQADSETVKYYVANGLPRRDVNATDVEGVGGFVNIKPGQVVVTTTVAAGDRLAGTVAVQTRPGHVTMVQVVPTGG